MIKIHGPKENPALALRESISEPWRKALILGHAQARHGSVSTFENGIDAFETYLRQASGSEDYALYLSMLIGRADPKTVVETYIREILDGSRDNPPIVSTSASGFIARAPFGRIAVVPRNEIHRGDVRQASLVIMDDRRLPDDGMPRFLWPGDTYIAEALPREWIRTNAGRLAQSGGMNVFFDEADYTFTVSSFGDPHGSFSIVDRLADTVGRIEDPTQYRRAWLNHLEAMLDEMVHAVAAVERALERESELYGSSFAVDPLVRDRSRLALAMRRMFGFASAANKAFILFYPHKDSREYDFIHDQVAKINNAIPPAKYCFKYEDLSHSDVRAAIKSIMNCMDPTDLIDKPYRANRVEKWIKVEFEGGRKKSFEAKRSPALRMLIDEIVYEAANPDGGPRKELSFEIAGNRITALDRSGGRALAPFAEVGKKRKSLEGLAAKMGAGASIGFSEEPGGGERRLRAIHIFAPQKDAGGGHGRGTGNEGKETIPAAGGIYGLAPAAQTMLYGAALGMAGIAAPMGL